MEREDESQIESGAGERELAAEEPRTRLRQAEGLCSDGEALALHEI